MKVWCGWPGEHSSSIWIFVTTDNILPEEIDSKWYRCLRRHMYRADPEFEVEVESKNDVLSLYAHFWSSEETWEAARRVISCFERSLPSIGFLGFLCIWHTEMLMRNPQKVLYNDIIVRWLLEDWLIE